MSLSIQDLCSGVLPENESKIDWNYSILHQMEIELSTLYMNTSITVYKDILDNLERLPYFLIEQRHTLGYKYYKSIYNNILLRELKFMGKLKGIDTNSDDVAELCKKIFTNQAINFIFIRHGESCQNLANNILDVNIRRKFLLEFQDPTLSDIGLKDSIRKGEFLTEQLRDKFNITNYDIIGASSMLRSIETAAMMTATSKEKIHVYPYLREIIKEKNLTPAELDIYFPLKSINQQREYFKSVGASVADRIDFKHVQDTQIRFTPGDLNKFMSWFVKNVNIPDKPIVNVLIITHSGVLVKFGSKFLYNNTGCIVPTVYTKLKKKIHYNPENIIQYIGDSSNPSKTECPTKRCKNVC